MMIATATVLAACGNTDDEATEPPIPMETVTADTSEPETTEPETTEPETTEPETTEETEDPSEEPTTLDPSPTDEPTDESTVPPNTDFPPEVTIPGTILALGEPAGIQYVVDSGAMARLKVTVDDNTMAALDTDAPDGDGFHVFFTVEALDDVPELAGYDVVSDFQVIGANGEEHELVAGTGESCEALPMPEGFAAGDTYQSCGYVEGLSDTDALEIVYAPDYNQMYLDYPLKWKVN